MTFQKNTSSTNFDMSETAIKLDLSETEKKMY